MDHQDTKERPYYQISYMDSKTSCCWPPFFWFSVQPIMHLKNLMKVAKVRTGKFSTLNWEDHSFDQQKSKPSKVGFSLCPLKLQPVNRWMFVTFPGHVLLLCLQNVTHIVWFLVTMGEKSHLYIVLLLQHDVLPERERLLWSLKLRRSCPHLKCCFMCL